MTVSFLTVLFSPVCIASKEHLRQKQCESTKRSFSKTVVPIQNIRTNPEHNEDRRYDTDNLWTSKFPFPFVLQQSAVS